MAMYSLIQPATRSSPVYLHAVKNEPLRIESALICQDTGGSPGSLHLCRACHL